MQNKPQYDIDRKAAKISSLSSNNLEKYEYLTGEDFGFKPSAIEQTEFEYSSLGKIFNMGLDKKEKDKKEGLFKRLKNIENAQKNVISSNDDDDDDDDMMMKVFTTHLDHNLMKKIKCTQNHQMSLII